MAVSSENCYLFKLDPPKCCHWHLLSIHCTDGFKIRMDEMFLAGEIRETNQTKVLKQLLMLQSLE